MGKARLGRRERLLKRNQWLAWYAVRDAVIADNLSQPKPKSLGKQGYRSAPSFESRLASVHHKWARLESSGKAGKIVDGKVKRKLVDPYGGKSVIKPLSASGGGKITDTVIRPAPNTPPRSK
jgi:hypothetical protein